ncbi:amino acid/amide ABC transporter substrate-binding protein, HAAT family [Friedmanniella luteola]|uniref:Amino acid/amide ABC transporter substrate-binding protein, HAAT family n=1 Tax=Friedmanniella luteola TaxID=546871 RepID=A0A1H1PEX4_9ACTN|nr:branched-chain amino acid ABC transporter substrate-binding protein [Friedmanniella luteola]SDS09565.1 amino acid/amide ABC transporter substrate-binding protein, HAAT family [Friedmanniella luteola]
MRKQLVLTGATLLATVLAVSSCGTRAEEATGGSGETATKVAKIGVIAPLSGDLSALGLGIQNAVDLAVKQANEKGTIPGWTLEIDPQDDQALPDTGKNAATKLAGDDEVVGVVGTLNSSVAQSVQPVLSGANIAQVSPANTNPTLTKGADPASPKRSYPGYFRTCTTDDVQGPFAARYLLDQGIKKVATIHDKKAYGQGLVAAFTDAFKSGGGTIVQAETINPDDKDFSAVISKVKGAGPEAVYYGGEFPQSGPLAQQARAAGLDVPVMGGDGMYTPSYIELAGKTSEGDLATSVGAPVETLDSAKQFVTDYAAGGYDQPYEAYGAYAYDAANAIINGLKVSLASAADAKSARQATIDAIGKVSFDGASGPVAFDEFGDNTTKILTVYKVTDGKWKADKTGS